MNTRTMTLAMAAVVLLSLAGCGESPQIVKYKQGDYQGKSDTRPYEGAPFKGDKAAWENALANRNQSQNEYKKAQ